ncbi:MAG: anaerobic ribonucleoside-triphosphate reductase activating protein [Peptococcaceae bacterium]|nr:anaerobic ribonucleoside-triphosphate reductase activating protein [Peptococcaceae bacterium]
MNIQGMQKLTLLDYPGQVACTIFTGGCQLNCPYCHNSLLINGPFDDCLAAEEVLAFLQKRQGLLDGICVSGGEPLLQKELPEFLRACKNLGYKIKLDTNGGYPEKLAQLIDAGLVDRVAMDIKNAPEKYAATCGCEHLDLAPYIASRDLLLSAQVEYEFRTTVVRQLHSFEDVLEIARWIPGARHFYLQAFVDREQVRDHHLSAYTDEEMRALLSAVQKILPSAELRGI